jgi:DNA-binding NtrC family response regulator
MRTDYTRILVVDDEIGYRKVLNNALTERGFIVKTAVRNCTNRYETSRWY